MIYDGSPSSALKIALALREAQISVTRRLNGYLVIFTSTYRKVYSTGDYINIDAIISKNTEGAEL